jgi:Tol biopolymer transport system component
MLTAPRVTVHEFVGTNENPTWSPDGRFLSWISQRGASPAPVRNHLVVRALDSGQTRTFEVALNFPPNRSMWAPDSRAMIVQGSEPGGRQGIFRIDTATGRMSPIVMATGAQDLLQLLPIDQSWSPDGRRFYFRRFTQRGGSLVDLVERDLSSGDDRQLFVGPRVTLSPDRRTAYYRREIPNGRQVPHEMRTSDGQSSLGTVPETALIARDLASGTERELIRRVMFPVLARGPDLSPDGRHILVTTLDAEAGIWLVGMVSTEGGQYRELWRQSSATRQPGGNWAPGGRSVIVWSPLTNRIGEPAENWWVPLDGRERRRLDPASPLGNVHPDGRRTVFVSRPASEPKQVLVFDQVAAASVPAR